MQFIPFISLDNLFTFTHCGHLLCSVLCDYDTESHVVRDGFELIKYLKLARTPDPHACWDDRHTSPRLAL